MTGRIILIGMPASGKTTIGTALSRALSVPLYDADALAEQTVGCSIPEIFAAEGERLPCPGTPDAGSALHRDGNTLRHRHRRWCGVDGAEP